MLTPERRRDPRGERGAVLVVAAILIPLFIAIGAIVVDVGDFFEHRRELQTKADASALAAGGRWAWPCSSTIDANMTAEARQYVGYHTKADGSLHNSGPQLNDQVGGTNIADIHVVLNAAEFWDDAAPEPADFSDGSGASPCASQYVDVKVTEKDVNAFFGFIEPDVKAEARVEIQQAEALSGLLPIAVRVPEPRSAAVIFFDEATGAILDAKYMTRSTTGSSPVPPSLARWTTGSGDTVSSGPSDPSVPIPPNPASVLMPAGGGSVGVTVATSFFPRCGGGASPCFDLTGFASVTDLCRQGGGIVARCTYATGTGASQSVPYGVEKIRSYVDFSVNGGSVGPPVIPADPPALESAWLESGSCNYLGQAGAYFNAVPPGCTVSMRVIIDTGGTRVPDSGGDPFSNADDVRVRIAGGSCPNNFNDATPNCQLDYVAGSEWRTRAGFGPTVTGSLGTGFKILVELRDTKVGAANCSTFNSGGSCDTEFPNTSAPSATNNVHRTFLGDDDSTGPIKFLRVYDGSGNAEGSGNSKLQGTTESFTVDMGLRGLAATTQADPPFAFDNKSNQSGALDCDPNIPNIRQEVEFGCGLVFGEADLTLTPNICPNQNMPQIYDSPNAPFDTLWPAYTCVVTQTTSAFAQAVSGFNNRFFGVNNNPSCPAETGPFTKGRNYWSDANNNTFPDVWTFPNINPNDPRLITLFLTSYDSVLGTGNQVFPIIGFAQFYVTGYGREQGGLQIDDPCPGSTPPSDLVVSSGGTYVWGHLVKGVAGPTGGFGGSGQLCNPASLTPCVPVLVK